MSNFNSIGSGVSEPHVAENRYIPLTGGYRPYNSIRTNVLYCDHVWGARLKKYPSQSLK